MQLVDKVPLLMGDIKSLYCSAKFFRVAATRLRSDPLMQSEQRHLTLSVQKSIDLVTGMAEVTNANDWRSKLSNYIEDCVWS